MLPSLAGMAGGALGTFLGGPAGGMIGSSLGSSLGDSLFGGGSNQQNPQQNQMQPGQSYGGQFGNTMGNTIQQGFNQYMPSNFQGQTFGNLGSAAGEYFGGKLGHPNFGKIVGGMADHYLSQRMPQDLRNTRIGDFGNYAGNQLGQQIDNGMQRYGMNPYYGGVPMAPDAGDLYSRAPGGQMGNGGGYNIPQAPAFAAPQMQNQRYGMPSPQSGRGAMLNDIRNYRRPVPNAFGGGNNMYAGAPEAPPFDLQMPGSRSYRSSPGSMMDEYRQRIGGNNFGLKSRPSISQSFSSPEGGMMGSLRDSMAQRRAMIEPEDDGDWEAPAAPVRSFHKSPFNPGMTQRWGS